MLDRPAPFNNRLRATWPACTAANAAIEQALETLATMLDGSQPFDRRDGRDARDSDARKRDGTPRRRA